MLRLCLVLLLFLPLASAAQKPVARLLPRQVALQVPTPTVAAPAIRLVVCSFRCIVIHTPEPRVVPDQIWLRMWLGMPPDLR
jgi:hypothetical protein